MQASSGSNTERRGDLPSALHILWIFLGRRPQGMLRGPFSAIRLAQVTSPQHLPPKSGGLRCFVVLVPLSPDQTYIRPRSLEGTLARRRRSKLSHQIASPRRRSAVTHLGPPETSGSGRGCKVYVRTLTFLYMYWCALHIASKPGAWRFGAYISMSSRRSWDPQTFAL